MAYKQHNNKSLTGILPVFDSCFELNLSHVTLWFTLQPILRVMLKVHSCILDGDSKEEVEELTFSKVLDRHGIS